MKSRCFKVLLLLAWVWFFATLPGQCQDRSHPFGPSGAWFFKDLGWKLGNKSHYAVRLMLDPPLTREGVEPIGVSIRNTSPRLGNNDPEPAGPTATPFCSFDGLIWTLVDQFGYSARAILGRDQSLIGFSFRVWNNSKNHPLVLMRQPGAPLFLTDIFPEEIRQKAPESARNENKPVEWTLKPREKEEVFLPLRDLLPKGFDPKDGTICHFSVQVNVWPKSDKTYMESPFPDVSGIAALMTKAGLALDPKEALKEAGSVTPVPFQKNRMPK